jgi:prepilin-type N-terminal cleavage/methylation domain-containing protein
MRTWTVLRRRLHGQGRMQGQGGFSLPELMVTIGVLSIVMTAVGTVFVGSLKSVRVVRERTVTAADARIALEAVTRSLRVAVRPDGEATALTLATGSAVTFYSVINRSGTTADPLPSKVEYSWDGTCLNEAVTPARALSSPPSGGPFYAWDTGRTSKCLVRTVTAPSFAYFSTPQISSGGVDVSPMTVPVGGLTGTDLGLVQSVQLTLSVRVSAGLTNGTTVMDRVTLTNVLLDTGT